MIVVDTSVLIAVVRDDKSRAVRVLLEQLRPADVIIGDIVLLELLRGARDDAHAERLRGKFADFRIARLLDETLAAKAARHYRALRAIGITMSKTTDLIIATFCIEHGHLLLQQDRDFEAMARHAGLRLA